MIIILMGVSGCGKTTVGRRLAQRLDAEFFDGDDFHPPANVEKMRNGTPLTDEDRIGWLERLRETIEEQIEGGRSAVLACSALRKLHRDQLRRAGSDIHFVHLKGDFKTIKARLEKRGGHYMPSSLLESQFAALEEPVNAITIAIDQSPEDAVEKIMVKLTEDETEQSNC